MFDGRHRLGTCHRTCILTCGFTAGRRHTAPVQHSTDYKRPDKQQRYHRYLKSMFGYGDAWQSSRRRRVLDLVKHARGLGSGHGRDFGKRFANNVARNVIKNTTQFGLEEAFKLDSQYIRTEKKSVGYRIGYAAISPLVARNEHGRMVVRISTHRRDICRNLYCVTDLVPRTQRLAGRPAGRCDRAWNNLAVQSDQRVRS